MIWGSRLNVEECTDRLGGKRGPSQLHGLPAE
jgi:hypothetical protein